jgi:octaprenyl-diphosphate synthase
MTAYIVELLVGVANISGRHRAVPAELAIIREIPRKVKDLSGAFPGVGGPIRPAFAPAPMNDPAAPVSLESIRAPILEDLAAVDAVIRRRLDSDVALIRTVASHIIASGGKRLRPALVLLAAKAFDARGSARHELAAVIEFIHTATLLHDDVVDESSLRRGRKTANAEFGNAASVLVGDFLYSRAFQMIVDAGSLRIMKVLADATNVIAEGEVLQLLNVHDADTGEESYLRVIRYKTAKLFEAATQVGAILGGASPDTERALAEYGMHLGTAFQLIDDVLDYSGDLQETGKNLGDDLAEGKPTLPLIRVMREGTQGERSLVRRAVEQGGKADLEGVVAAIHRVGALDYTRERARSEAAIATARLEGLADSACRDSLLQLAHFSVERKF